MVSNWPNTVTIGSFVADQDAPGDYRVTRKVGGWGTPATRSVTSPNVGRHGAWLVYGFFGERVIEHEGYVECDTAAAANAVADELVAFEPDEPLAYVVDNESIGARQVTAYVAVGATPEWIDDRSFTYGLTLVAPYPFKQAVGATTVTLAPGSNTFTNNGSAIAEFEAETTSSGTVVLSAGGLTLSTYSLPAGSVISSMPGRRGITGPSGEDLSSSLVPGYLWPAIVPGSNTFASSGSAGVSLSFYDSFA